MKVRRILVPVDFTPGSHLAVRQARAIASEFESFLHVLYVTHPQDARQWTLSAGTEFCPAKSPTVDQHGRLQALHNLAALIASERLDPFRTTGLVRCGRPEDVITGYADEINADLIVMGLHGDRLAPPERMGQVLERVLNHATCPVLAVPAPQVATQPIAVKEMELQPLAC